MDLANALAHLRAGDWERAHVIVQADHSPPSCWAHGIVHLIQGDVDNARYWYGRAGRAWPATPDAHTEIAALAGAIARDKGER